MAASEFTNPCSTPKTFKRNPFVISMPEILCVLYFIFANIFWSNGKTES
jgi:hypothetical protein